MRLFQREMAAYGPRTHPRVLLGGLFPPVGYHAVLPIRAPKGHGVEPCRALRVSEDA
jgi:hypothetical protein